jgi:hypothetical protein
LIPPAQPTEEFDPEAYRAAVHDVVEAVSFLAHLVDVAHGVAV